MSTPQLDLVDLPTTEWHAEGTHVAHEYLTVREVAPLLLKSPNRLYAMIGEGLLDAVGLHTFRTSNGRIWIAIPRDGSLGLSLLVEEGIIKA